MSEPALIALIGGILTAVVGAVLTWVLTREDLAMGRVVLGVVVGGLAGALAGAVPDYSSARALSPKGDLVDYSPVLRTISVPLGCAIGALIGALAGAVASNPNSIPLPRWARICLSVLVCILAAVLVISLILPALTSSGRLNSAAHEGRPNKLLQQTAHAILVRRGIRSSPREAAAELWRSAAQRVWLCHTANRKTMTSPAQAARMSPASSSEVRPQVCYRLATVSPTIRRPSRSLPPLS